MFWTNLSLLCLILSVIPIDLYGFPGLQKPQTSMKFPQKYGPPIYILGENDINCDRCDRCYLVQLKVGNKKFYLLIQNDDENAKTAPFTPLLLIFSFVDGDDDDDDVDDDNKALHEKQKRVTMQRRRRRIFVECHISQSKKQTKLFAIFKLISTSSLSSLSTAAATTATTPPVTKMKLYFCCLSRSFQKDFPPSFPHLIPTFSHS